MTGIRLTKRVIDGLEITGPDYVAWDADLPGFGVRVRASGVKSYIVFYRAGSGRNAPKRKLTIGPVGKLTPDEARTLAKKALGQVANGSDPAAIKTEERKALIVSELADLFLSDHVEAKRKPGTAKHYRDIIERIVLPDLGTMKVDKVSFSDIARIHLKWKRTPYQANRVLAVIASMYSFAAKRKFISNGFNPAHGLEKYAEEGRERFLSIEELERLGAAIREAEEAGIAWAVDDSKPSSKHVPKDNRRTIIGPHAAGALRLLLFTGCRLREILHLKWENVDFERGLVFLPDSKTGKKTVVLNAPALAVLNALPRVGGFVIAGEAEDKPRTDLKRPWAMVTKRANLEGLRIHDIRHSFASFGAGGGMGLPIVGKLLGHANATTTARSMPIWMRTRFAGLQSASEAPLPQRWVTERCRIAQKSSGYGNRQPAICIWPMIRCEMQPMKFPNPSMRPLRVTHREKSFRRGNQDGRPSGSVKTSYSLRVDWVLSAYRERL
jgi:integrase